ncbi:MAG TPA: hypothetical protein VMH85_13970, partial [Terriglobales bacterium]|nr:hypothetical protein [Terriglobales bacterium]
ARHGNGACHAMMRIQISGTTLPVPALESAKPAAHLGLGVNINHAVSRRGNEKGKAVEAVRLNPIATALSEELGAQGGPLLLEAELQQNSLQGFKKFRKGDAQHLDRLNAEVRPGRYKQGEINRKRQR